MNNPNVKVPNFEDFETAQRLMKVIGTTQKKLERLGFNRTKKLFSDFVEAYACARFNLTLAQNTNQPGYDATDKDGKRYQIKYVSLNGYHDNGRLRVTSYYNNLHLDSFEYLILVLLDNNYVINSVAKVGIDDILDERNFHWIRNPNNLNQNELINSNNPVTLRLSARNNDIIQEILDSHGVPVIPEN